LTVDVELPPKFTLFAERRFSAISKDDLVLVEGSLNMFTIVAPLSVGTCLILRSLTSLKVWAVCKICIMSEAEYFEMSIKCL
jgi:hypothetical protein